MLIHKLTNSPLNLIIIKWMHHINIKKIMQTIYRLIKFRIVYRLMCRQSNN